MSKAAVLADEFVLTHKNVFSPISHPDRPTAFRSAQLESSRSAARPVRLPSPPHGERECFYCHKKGHLIADCQALKCKQQLSSQQKGVGLIKATENGRAFQPNNNHPDPCFKPFILEGVVSLTGNLKDQQPVKILRDTGASQSIIREDVLPFSEESFCQSSVLVQGVELGFVSAPLHTIHIQSSLVSGIVKVAIRSALPIPGIDFILGNDLAGGKVMPVPEVLDRPELSLDSDSAQDQPAIFPACVVTRAQTKKYGPDLADSFMRSDPFGDVITFTSGSKGQAKVPPADKTQPILNLPVSREDFITAQKNDVTLSKCHSSILSQQDAKKKKLAYFLDEGLLMRRWTSEVSEDADWSAVYQMPAQLGPERCFSRRIPRALTIL
ncbi:kelch-like protein 33 [Sarotherodon galilaeus]